MATINPDTWEYVDDLDREIQIEIETRLLTERGSRIGRPGYGTEIHSQLRKPFTAEVRALIRRQVMTALSDLITVGPVEITQPEPGAINISINETYNVRVSA